MGYGLYGFRAHIAFTCLGKAADPHLPSWPCGYICRAKVRTLGGSVKFISAHYHFWLNLPSNQAGNKPCPAPAKGWEWNVHIYFSFCSSGHKDPVNAQEEKGGGTEKELPTSIHPPVSTLVPRSTWRSSLQNGSAVPLQGQHVFPSVLSCCTIIAFLQCQWLQGEDSSPPCSHSLHQSPGIPTRWGSLYSSVGSWSGCHLTAHPGPQPSLCGAQPR